MGSMREYDIVVIGSGPGGQKAAIASAKLGKSVAIVERGRMLGGVCVNTGTIPSKTLREAVLYLTGMNQRELYGASYRVKDRITPADLLARTQHVIGKEVDVVRNQLMRNRVDLIVGHGRFIDPHTILVEDQARREKTTVTGDYIIIATGTRPARPSGVEFDEERVLDSDGILDLKSLPSSMVVVGAGVIGIEYASMFAALGTKVTVVEKRDNMLDFCDPEVVEALKFHLRDLAEPAGIVQVSYHGDLTAISARSEWAPEFAIHDLDSLDALAAADPADFPDDIAHYLWTWTDRSAGSLRARMFAANLGVTEDEATGAAAIRITDYLSRDLTITQGKGSLIHTTWSPEGWVRVAGRVVSDGVAQLD